MASQRHIGGAAVDQRFYEIRSVENGLIEGLQRVFNAVQSLQSAPSDEMGLRKAWIYGDGLADQAFRLAILRRLESQIAKRVERFELPRVEFQHLAVKARGFAEIAGLM